MKRALGIGLVLIAGCSAPFQYRVETRPPVWNDTAWTAELGEPLQVRSVGDTIYVSATMGIYATKGGQKLWATAPMPPAERYIDIGEGKIVATSYTIGESKHSFADRSGSDVNRRENGHVTGFDATSGQQLWDVPFDSEKSKLSPPTIAQGRAVVISGPNVLAIDLASGQVVWTQRSAPDNKLVRTIPYSRVAPAVVNGHVCVALMTEFHVYDLATGQRLGKKGANGGGAAANAVADGGFCYMARSSSPDGGGANEVWAVDPSKKLDREWSANLGIKKQSGFNSVTILDPGVSNIATNDKYVYAVTNYKVAAFDKKTGKKKWIVEGGPVFRVSAQRGTRVSKQDASWFNFGALASFNDRPGTNFAVTNARVYVPARDPATKTDVVSVLDAETGAYLGSLGLNGAIVLDLAIAADGALVMATSQGLMTAKADSFTATPAVAVK